MGTSIEHKQLDRYSGYVALMRNISDSEPSSYEEDVEKQVWKYVMTQEYHSILKNDVSDIAPRPERKSFLTSRWLYKIKHVADGSVEKYKSKFVSRGFSKKESIDYEETFSLMARCTTIRYIISLVSVLVWKLHHLDVKTIFLNGEVGEEAYIEHLEGFEIHGK